MHSQQVQQSCCVSAWEGPNGQGDMDDRSPGGQKVAALTATSACTRCRSVSGLQPAARAQLCTTVASRRVPSPGCCPTSCCSTASRASRCSGGRLSSKLYCCSALRITACLFGCSQWMPYRCTRKLIRCCSKLGCRHNSPIATGDFRSKSPSSCSPVLPLLGLLPSANSGASTSTAGSKLRAWAAAGSCIKQRAASPAVTPSSASSANSTAARWSAGKLNR